MVRTVSVVNVFVPSVRVWAYANGQVHPEFCLTRNCLIFFQGGVQVAFEDRSTNHSSTGTFLGLNGDQQRPGYTVT